MLDREAVRDIAIKYAAEVRKVLSPDAILVFGSHVSGKATEYSDIDIAIICNDFDGDWYETTIALSRLAREFSFDIEPHLLDGARDDSGFVEHILKTGECVYSAG